MRKTRGGDCWAAAGLALQRRPSAAGGAKRWGDEGRGRGEEGRWRRVVDDGRIGEKEKADDGEDAVVISVGGGGRIGAGRGRRRQAGF
jgi:hypothetical protein